MEKEWYKDWFNSPYYDILYYKRNQHEAAAFITLLIKYLKPAVGCNMLDVACGKGRHSRVLADMGFDVTGIDLSETAIKEANSQASENLHFFLHDMRLPFYVNYFDYAFNFFTSFGYFNSSRENNNALRSITQSLRRNGLLVIDYLNTTYVENHLIKTETIVLDNTHFNITRWQNTFHFFKQIEVVKNNAVITAYTEKVAKFSLADFEQMMAHQHLEIQQIFGDYQLDKYDAVNSPRMIIIAGKSAS